MTETTEKQVSLMPDWLLALPIQQQGVLMLAARGPDGIAKFHPCKEVVRAYRATVMTCARIGRMVEWGERVDTFMGLELFVHHHLWGSVVGNFFDNIDSLPHHFLMHLMHGAEIIGYKHPDERFRERWYGFYQRSCEDMHLPMETEKTMDERLNDWGQEHWS